MRRERCIVSTDCALLQAGLSCATLRAGRKCECPCRTGLLRPAYYPVTASTFSTASAALYRPCYGQRGASLPGQSGSIHLRLSVYAVIPRLVMSCWLGRSRKPHSTAAVRACEAEIARAKLGRAVGRAIRRRRLLSRPQPRSVVRAIPSSAIRQEDCEKIEHAAGGRSKATARCSEPSAERRQWSSEQELRGGEPTLL